MSDNKASKGARGRPEERLKIDATFEEAMQRLLQSSSKKNLGEGGGSEPGSAPDEPDDDENEDA